MPSIRSLPGRRAVLAVRAVRVAVSTAVVGTALALTLSGAIATPAGDPSPSSGATSGEASVRQAEQAAVDARCVGAEGRAIVLTPGGRTRAVPFEQGWEVYRGERPGVLVTVCPD